MKAPILWMAAACAAAACHRAPPAPAPPAPVSAAAAAAGPSLYQRLGGRPAIAAVVADFVTRVTTDARISAFFRGVDRDTLAAGLTDQICEVAGGPCRYTGRSMRAVHADLGIGNADFDALVSDLVASLDHFTVGATEQAELLRILGGLRREIVTKP